MGATDTENPENDGSAAKTGAGLAAVAAGSRQPRKQA